MTVDEQSRGKTEEVMEEATEAAKVGEKAETGLPPS